MNIMTYNPIIFQGTMSYMMDSGALAGFENLIIVTLTVDANGTLPLLNNA